MARHSKEWIVRQRCKLLRRKYNRAPISIEIFDAARIGTPTTSVGGVCVTENNCVSTFPLKPTEAASFTIGDLSREFGVTTRALRFYEEEGLISPRREGFARIYSRRDRARLVWILRGKRVGFSLDDIAELLDLYDLNDGRVKQKAVAAERCRARADVLRGQIAGLQASVAQLAQFADTLEAQS